MFDKYVESVLLNFNIGKLHSFSALPINSGLSGSLVFKVTSFNGVFALKSYTQSSLSSLQSSHSLIETSYKNSFKLFPLIISGKNSNKIVFQNGYYWDLSSWISGVIPEISRDNLLQSINKLAEFHVAIGFDQSEYAVMPAMESRVREISAFSLEAINLACLSVLPVSSLIEHLVWIRQEINSLNVSAIPTVKIQFCWGDARRENILFDNNKINGFIDYNVMRMDCKEVDVSRMISSFAADDYTMWTDALNAYTAKESINYLDCRKLDLLGTINSFYRWLAWLQNPMPIPRMHQGLQRFTALFERIKKWKEHGSLKSMLFYD